MTQDFALHPLLIKDTVTLLDWPLCRVTLMKDANYPWLVLVPRRPGLVDLDEVAEADRAQLTAEITQASRRLKALTQAHKMNVAALGNLCPQLHVHVIARFPDDAAWPKPVWGQVPTLPYPPEALAERIATLTRALTPGSGR